MASCHTTLPHKYRGERLKGVQRELSGARVLLIEGLPHCQKYLCVTFAESNKGESAFIGEDSCSARS